MKRQKRKPQKARPDASSAPSQPAPARPISRRNMMREVAMFGVAAAVIGSGGYYLVSEVVADVHEHDLSRIGKGIPTVVQVHDPDCPTCRSLMRAARTAMESFEPDELQYVVANLQTPEGQELASRHGVGKVTLLLMDGDGRRRATLPGEASSAMLLPDFQRHAKRYAKGAVD